MSIFTSIQIFAGVFSEYWIVSKVMKDRDVDFENIEKCAMIFILAVINTWSFLYLDNAVSIYSMIFSVPILIIVSITDINQRLVFDRDIICGIIVETGVISVQLFYDTLCRTEICETVFFKNGLYYNRSMAGFILGMLMLSAFNYILCRITGAMGTGDVVFFLYAGGFANMFGCIFIFFASFTACFLYCMVYRIINKNFGDGLISFTPFISIGIIIFHIVSC